MIVSDRSNGKNCPYCSNHRVCKDNSLTNLRPDIAKQWHTEKNGSLTPDHVTKGSSKKVWWFCPKKHIYKASVCDRTRKSKSTGCPYCSGKIVQEKNSLAALFPQLSSQWHHSKNGDLNPCALSKGSSRKVWWICPNGHEFQKRIKDRTKCKNPLVCPKCSPKNKNYT